MSNSSTAPAKAQPLTGIAHAARRRHIEALARRAQQHEGPARRLMEARLRQLREALATEAQPLPEDAACVPLSPLAALLAHVNTAAGSAAPAPASSPAGPRTAGPELKAICRYRGTWSRLSAEQRLHQALAQVPSNAGPLNTQRLLHQALAAMRDASPNYLHRFMLQVETLLWLEQLNSAAAPAAPGKAAGRKARG